MHPLACFFIMFNSLVCQCLWLFGQKDGKGGLKGVCVYKVILCRNVNFVTLSSVTFVFPNC